jgi:tetratricopeptide (TPR) repeat protein
LRAGNVAAAQSTARSVREAATAGDLQRQIALRQIADGRLPEARETALHITDDLSSALALGDVAAAKVRTGDIADANALAAHARKRYRAQVYGRIALARVDAGDLPGAVATLANIDDALYRSLTQSRIGAHRAATGDRAQAQKFFADAVTTLESAKTRDEIKSLTWAQLARIQFAAGERATAQESVHRAMDWLKATTGAQRDEALDAIARDQANMGDGEAALSTAAQVSDRVVRALLIRDVIASQPDAEAADALVRRSTAIADPLTRTAALFGLVAVQLLHTNAKHESDGAIRTIDAAREAVLATKEETLQPAALAALAAARVTLGNADAARPLFDEALNAAGALAPPEWRANAYLQILRALDERLYFLGKPLGSDDHDASPGAAAVQP